jgi:hypothetical protein
VVSGLGFDAGGGGGVALPRAWFFSLRGAGLAAMHGRWLDFRGAWSASVHGRVVAAQGLVIFFIFYFLFLLTPVRGGSHFLCRSPKKVTKESG